MNNENLLPSPDVIIDLKSDGQPIAEKTLQCHWIDTIVGGLEEVFRHDPNVFVAGNLVWYPVEGNPNIQTALQALVAVGRPKGHRSSYLQWKENNVPPQVAFEILSPSNWGIKVIRKFLFYERYGVEEFYLYHPDSKELSGWLRSGTKLQEIPHMNGWVSPRLGIRFELAEDGLRLYGPDGRNFATYLELVE